MVELSIVDWTQIYELFIVEYEIDELSIVEELSTIERITVEQLLTVEFLMLELSEIDELSTVELSITELSINSQMLTVTTGRIILFSSSVELGWSSTWPSCEVAPDESSLEHDMTLKLKVTSNKTEKILFIFFSITFEKFTPAMEKYVFRPVEYLLIIPEFK